MTNKVLVLALLLSPAAGCISRENPEEYPPQCESLMDLFVPRETSEGSPEHVHCVGCGHVLRGCLWVDNHQRPANPSNGP